MARPCQPPCHLMGFSGAQLRRLVSVQVVALSIVGATVGAVVGVVIGGQAWALVAGRVSLPNVTSIPLLAVLGVPLGIVGLAHLGATHSRRAAGRVPTAVALRAE